LATSVPTMAAALPIRMVSQMGWLAGLKDQPFEGADDEPDDDALMMR
jgi:hypothetical protein